MGLALIGLAPFIVDMGGPFYLGVAGVLGAAFVYFSWRVLVSPDDDKAAAKRLFAFSIFYLFAIFAAVLIEDLALLYV